MADEKRVQESNEDSAGQKDMKAPKIVSIESDDIKVAGTVSLQG